MTFKARVLTLFPEMFPGSLGHSIAGNALDKKLWSLQTLNIRDFANNKHKTVDDSPFGGGAGMVIKPDVIDNALCSLGLNSDDSGLDDSRGFGKIIYLSPRGKRFDQAMAKEIKKDGEVTLICGRYEGVDQRVIEKWNMLELSVGDYVLSGGEPAAQIVLDATIRLLDGVLGHKDSLIDESFEDGLLEYSHYTRPRVWQGLDVPQVLLSGNHQAIASWRMSERKRITTQRRPDMCNKKS